MKPPSAGHARASGGPFALDDESAYRIWREEKLAHYPRRTEDLIVEVRDPRNLRASEAQKLRSVCRRANMAIYTGPLAGDKDLPRRLGEQMNLQRLDANPLADDDGISSLRATADKAARGYIPYSTRRLQWHTDGYYNEPSRRIRAFILHCVQPAVDGGANGLLDPEIAYILLRDADRGHIRALSESAVMTVPANTEGGEAGRLAQSGPVFFVDAATGSLQMRYTARTRSIEWRHDEPTRAAAAALERLLADGSPYLLTHRLEAGQGLLCNNVLHNRSAYADADESPRLLFRARYYERIAGTDPMPAPQVSLTAREASQ